MILTPGSVVAGIMLVRDEADIIRTTVTHLAHQVDFVVVADNGSTDGTREILDELERDLPLTVLDDPEVGYYQSRKMTDLAAVAADEGADWVVPVDADEIWYARYASTLKDVLREVWPQWMTVAAELFDHVPTAVDPLSIECPTLRMGWRRTYAAPLPKVACRVVDGMVINQGNHSASYPGGATRLDYPFVVRHFPYRSPEQFIRKARNGAAAYAATDLPEEMGGHWRGYGAILDQHGEAALIENVYRKWFRREHPRERLIIEGEESLPLIFDPAPVQRSLP